MKIDLFLVSAYEEFAEKNACRKHWNFQWRGRNKKEDGIHICTQHWTYQWRARRHSSEKHMCKGHWNFKWRGRRKWNPYEGIHIRQESFGGLMQTPDGKLWKLDHEAYYWLNIAFGENI